VTAYGLALLGLLAAAGPLPQGTVVEEARVRSTLEDILAGTEYRRLRGRRTAEPEPPHQGEGGVHATATPAPARTERPPESRVPPPSPLTTGPLLSAAFVQGLQVLVYGLLAVAVCALVVLVIRNRRARVEDSDVGASPVVPGQGAAVPPGERAPDDYLTQALAQARGGRHREAIRLLLVGAMSSIERRGLIHHRQGLTNGDYLRSVRREPSLRRSLEPLVLTFDEVHFGRREASPERFDQCRRHFEAAFRER
jgi:hypothetical protein